MADIAMRRLIGRSNSAFAIPKPVGPGAGVQLKLGPVPGLPGALVRSSSAFASLAVKSWFDIPSPMKRSRLAIRGALNFTRRVPPSQDTSS